MPYLGRQFNNQRRMNMSNDLTGFNTAYTAFHNAAASGSDVSATAAVVLDEARSLGGLDEQQGYEVAEKLGALRTVLNGGAAAGSRTWTVEL
jgi:hypothetical protein